MRLVPLALLALALLPGCYGAPERRPVPVERTRDAVIPGVDRARFWSDEPPVFALENLVSRSDEELAEQLTAVYAREHNYLAISGGGANGAFGAGLLVGWTAAGTRPDFTMVTGVSTGALSAPFAFLGPDYDDDLKRLYTTMRTEDVLEPRGMLAGIFSDALADTTPLRRVLAAEIDEDFVDAIAAEHRKGRRLFIGTVNLDAGRSMIWSIGSIAASDSPRRVDLILDVLQASAAIPVAFPPIMIDVEVDGETYDEMHVDGGTGSQVFVYPAALDWQVVTEELRVPGRPQVYVIRNAFLETNSLGVNRNIMPIASRSIDSLIRTQGIGDLYQIHALCARDGNDFNLAYIPSTFTEVSNEEFDPVYMTALFQTGYELAKDGYDWYSAPPGFVIE